MPWGSLRTHPISQPAVPSCSHHPNTASSIPALEQYHKSGQLAAASHGMAVSPGQGAQASLSHCCWMAAFPPGAHPQPKGSHGPPTHPQQGTHTPPWLPHQHRLQSPHGGGREWHNSPTASKFLLHFLKLFQKIQNAQHHQRLQWPCPAQEAQQQLHHECGNL